MAQSVYIKIRDIYRRRGNLLYWFLFALLISTWFGYYFIYRPSQIIVARKIDMPMVIHRKLMISKPFSGARPRKNNRLDALVMLDVSGSMTWNDPQQLALVGIKLLADLLDPKDRLGICFFNDRVVKEKRVFLLGPNQYKRKNILKKFTKIFYGGGNNLGMALYRGLSQMRRVSAGRRAVVFFTDAQDNGPFNFRTKYSRADIRLLPVGFGSSINPDVFSLMSYEPYLSVKLADDLLPAFAKIFSRISDSIPRTLSEVSGKYSFSFKDKIDGFDVVALQDGANPINVTLYDAKGKVIKKGTPGFYKASESHYLVLKVGRKLLPRLNNGAHYVATAVFSPAPKDILLIPRYDFWLRVDLGSFQSKKKQGFIRSARLLNTRGSIVNPSGLRMEVVMDGPAGRMTWPLKKHVTTKGVFQGNFPFGQAGSYSFFVRAITTSFKKQSRRFQFKYRERFTYKFTPEAGDWGKIKKGKSIALTFKPLQTQYLNVAGEQFKLKLDWKKGQSNLRLSDNSVRVFSVLTNETLVRTYSGFPLLKPGTTIGSNFGYLNVKHLSSKGQRLPVSVTVVDLTLFEKIWPLIVTFLMLGSALYIFIRLVRYTPFNSRLSIFEYSDGMLFSKKIVHPGNRWMFGKPKIYFSNGSFLTPGQSGRVIHFFKKKDADGEAQEQDELLMVMSGKNKKITKGISKDKKYDRISYLPNSNYVLDGAILVVLAYGNHRNYNEMLKKMEERLERYRELYDRNFSDKPELLK